MEEQRRGMHLLYSTLLAGVFLMAFERHSFNVRSEICLVIFTDLRRLAGHCRDEVV